MPLEKYTIDKDAKLLHALKKIDNNKKGFLIVLDSNEVCGVITDGDIRRDLIRTENTDKTIETIYTNQFTYLTIDDEFEKVVEYFKGSKIQFLPILDENRHLKNIITKKNMHALLLKNIAYDPFYDFDSIDDTILEHEIFPRIWGFYKTTMLNDFCQCKILTLKPKSSISLQKHMRREEHWIIVNGYGKAIVGPKKIKIRAGTHLHIPKNTLHKLKNTSETEYLILTEVQLGDYFGEDDIIRIEDEYGRI